MARMARVVIPGVPHHVVQRGNRRMDVFFDDDDYRTYLRLVSTFARKSGTAIWAYCLMPNHVHLILVPSHADGLGGHWPKHTGSTPGRLTGERNGRDIFGRSGSTHTPCPMITCCTRRDISSSIL